jgi:adenosylhomocysteine nucleosidase
MILVCFAMPDEARPFHKRALQMPDVLVLLTGIGTRNAEAAVRKAFTRQRPEFVLSSGFAGGLDPQLPEGSLVFDAPDLLKPALLRAGARPARFHCAPRIAATAAEKKMLRSSTGADVVEMESKAIMEVCGNEGIPCATLRIVLDTATQDLPMDFNKFADSNQRLQLWKLLLAIAMSPGRIGPLLRFQKQCVAAAEKLSGALSETIKALS